METRAPYLLIGIFTLAVLLGSLGFFVWLAGVQVDRQYATYGIYFDDVSGLDASGDVRFNGIAVGRVIALRIDPTDPSRVLTTVEIDAATPIRTNTLAQLQSQGVTGVSYISLSGGTPDAAALTDADGGLPIIASRRSTLQSLVEDAPDLVTEATRLLEQFRAMTGPVNQAHVTGILQNLDRSSAQLDQALADFSTITGTVGDATAQIAGFTNRLDGLAEAITTTATNVDATLAAATRTFAGADRALADATPMIADAATATADVAALLRDDVPEIVADIAGTAAEARAAIADLHVRSGAALDDLAATPDLLNARLRELETSLQEADTAFAAVTAASETFDALVAGDGTLMVADARDVLAATRRTIAMIEAVTRDDVPSVVADLRTATATATAAIAQAASDVTQATGRVGPITDDAQATLAAARDLVLRAQASLDALDTTLTGADGALASATTAFDAASGVMQTDLDPVIADIRSAADRIATSVEQVTTDAPAITADLRALIARADATVAQVQGAVAATAPALGDFAGSGLPELTRLAGDARGLVATLDSLVRRIARDPARFILDDRVPEYRN
ncbi:phospholipid/cholesterol/gamma-HCH transport system substrate-binding protein [Loktanella fryxellensis]|uniref:Phospholipid/cholesterol/gamma-HCH transport system substrate-binding protein n=1 Tax=Loktanella fryxellensis TaxID=245187 RepID=A0A1H8HI68_9RHOB|nr:MlaD family protein [Loktanella fryxellensis]SEN55754.1 phospholipid/cholesterol/gamma-HCH transport system substrate-binding protein [Loktanella fryxellensis]